MHIVILDADTLKLPQSEYQKLEKIGSYELYKSTHSDQIIDRAYNADAIITNKAQINSKHMDQLPNLKYIGITATGVDNIDTQAAQQRGITVTNVPAYSTYSVAQLTIGLLLNISHQIGPHNDAVKQGDWAAQEHFSFWQHPLMELANLNIGLVGFGAIGQKVAEIAHALGLNILIFNRTPSKVKAPYKAASWEELLQNSDIISLHCPLTEQTRHCINRDSLNMIKSGAILLNTSRGGLIDEQALYDALTQGSLYAAGLDVMEAEPPQADNPLLSLDNCFITPHIGWATLEARQRLWEQVVNNLISFNSP